MNMNPFRKLWFWLLILSVIGFITSFVLFERYGQTNNDTGTPGWVWVILIVSAILWFVALGFYIADVAAYNKWLKVAAACGDLPPPKPEPKIECPKKQCVEAKIECVKKSPCNSPCNSPQVKVVEVSTITDNTALPKISPVTTMFTKEGIAEVAASSSGLKPISSLSAPVAV